MGGNVFKDLASSRLSKDEYFAQSSQVIDALTPITGAVMYRLLAYRSKESFGDCDIVVNHPDFGQFMQIVKDTFQLTSSDWRKNGPVFSCRINNFQYDFINAYGHYESAIFYYNWNDFGNLIGRMGHKLGIKASHRGLFVIVRHSSKSDHILREICISPNTSDILDILGLDADWHARGFETLEEMFTFVASSQYFDPDIYAFDNRNATSRVRDKKRPTYNKFLKWIADTHPRANHSFERKSELGGYSIRMPYYETILQPRYPNLKAEVDARIAQFEFDQQFAIVYNGTIIQQLVDLTGPALGQFMSYLRPQITQQMKESWIAEPSLVAPFIRVCSAQYIINT
jgi:hypothetical protein